MKTQLETLHSSLTGAVLGSEEASRLLIISLLAQGHALIQGAPGIGKTSLAQKLATSISCKFNRVQFTPDLLPADILGYSMFHQGKNAFEFVEGPIFSNIVLADEINRTSPRIQSALLECMNEQQVSIDGVTRQLESPFMVIATQNDQYATGTFPLPEPQLDRFLVSVRMSLPNLTTQSKILELHAGGNPNGIDVEQVLDAAEISQMQAEVLQIPNKDSLCTYIVNLCEGTRRKNDLWTGVSARASIALMRAAQAAAYLEGNKAVYPDHVKSVAIPVLSHRLGAGTLDSTTAATVDGFLANLLEHSPVP